MDDQTGFHLVEGSEHEGWYEGPSVGGAAGDVNGDGIGDLVIGAPEFIGGMTYVIFGSAAGFPNTLDLSALDGSDGFKMPVMSGFYDTVAGAAISRAGDVNGDGIDDVVFGEPNLSASYVVFGSKTDFAAAVDPATLDGTTGFRLDGTDSAGAAVAGPGDVNGDGIDDLLVAGGGYSYVVFGSAAGFGAAVELAALRGTDGIRLDFSGGFSPGSAADFNGDGIDDLIVGMSFVFGSSAGLPAEVVWDSLDGANGFKIYDEQNTSWHLQCQSAGDINGDGIDDLVVGNPGVGSSYTK